MKQLLGIALAIVLGMAVKAEAAPGDIYLVNWSGPIERSTSNNFVDTFMFVDDEFPIGPGVYMGSFESLSGLQGTYIYYSFVNYTVFQGSYREDGFTLAANGDVYRDRVRATGLLLDEDDRSISGHYRIRGSISTAPLP